MHHYVRKTEIAAPAKAVFAYHQKPEAFQLLTPPWVKMKVLRHEGVLDGNRVDLELRAGLLPIKWNLIHRDYIPDVQFKDVQVSGPFASWEHTHRFVEDGAHCILEDDIYFSFVVELPFLDSIIKHDLDRLFDFRQTVLAREFPAK